MTWIFGLKRCGVLLVASVALAACSPSWQNLRKEETFKGPTRAYTAVLPEGWKRAPTDSDVLLITRDGLFLQQISVVKYSLDEAFADKKISSDTPPQELALLQYKKLRDEEQDLAQVQKAETKGVLALFPVSHAKPLPGTTERVAIKPFKLDGHDAFLLETRSYNSWGLEYQSEAIGVVHEGDYWLIRYLAPKLYYAHRDQVTFDRFLAQFKLKPKCRVFCSD
ncbi:MAG: hypothetical protein KGN37_10795 [Burkholderiales bacterium]|nr:hypothetical protein [Burkholderiales bacterium]